MNIFQQYLSAEFVEDYQEGRISRRSALKMIAAVTGSLIVANSLLAGCAAPEETLATEPAAPAASPITAAASPAASATAEPAVATAASTAAPTQPAGSPTDQVFPQAYGTVMPSDPAVTATVIEFSGADGAAMTAYLARPSAEGAYPVVMVCHENRGLTEHIQDVARRLGKAGYVALAVDLLARQGGTPALSSDEIPGILGNAPAGQFVQDFRQGWLALHGQPFAQVDRLGMVGFCFGGGVTWQAAVGFPELLAAVPFYGPHPLVSDVPSIQAAVRAIYAARDQRINQGIADIEAAMQTNGKTYEKIIYPESDHAFHNDTGSRYNPAAAQDAWAKTLEWFARYL